MKYDEAIPHIHDGKSARRAAWPESVRVRRVVPGEHHFGTYVRLEQGKPDAHFIVTAEDITAEDWDLVEDKAPEPAKPPMVVNDDTKKVWER